MKIDTADAERGERGWLVLAVWNVILPALLAAIAVVSVLPLNFAAFGLWLALLVCSARKQLRQQRAMLAWMSVVVQVAVSAVIVTAAHLAPDKTTDQFLERTITLPKPRMTLAELEGDPEGLRPQWRPVSLAIAAPEDERSTVIVFPESMLTLRQFVDAVESQSTLRHRFHHCGNGWTILWGGDCSFGLQLRQPPIGN